MMALIIHLFILFEEPWGLHWYWHSEVPHLLKTMFKKENCKKLKSYIAEARIQKLRKKREEREKALTEIKKKLERIPTKEYAVKYRKLFG